MLTYSFMMSNKLEQRIFPALNLDAIITSTRGILERSFELAFH